MSVSIVIPCYNAERYLAKTVESVLAQSCREWELLIVNDGSGDSTAQIAARYAGQDNRIKLIEKTNAGVAEARNSGFAQISPDCEYVCFLDADDVLEPTALSTLTNVLETNQNAVAAHGDVRYIGERGESVMAPPVREQVVERRALVGDEIMPCPSSRLTTFEMLIVANCVATPGACLTRRTEMEAVGLFDRATSTCEDWDLWIRLARRGSIAYTDHVVLAYRRHPGNASNKLVEHQMAGDRVRNKATFSLENSPRQAEIARTVNDLLSSEEYGLRMQWAREAFQQGKMFAAAKQFRHASLARARTRHLI